MIQPHGDQVEIIAVYPGLLRAPGDRGNAETLVRRLAWRGHRPRLRTVEHDQPIPDDGRLYLIGGAEGPAQVAAAHLLAADGTLAQVAAAGAIVFATGGGYQVLGRSFAAPDGTRVDGLGLLDVETVPSTDEARGEVVGRLRELPDGRGKTLPAATDDPIDADQATSDPRVITGYEDHAGIIHLGPDADPLAMISVGYGNCGDGTEGAVTRTTMGTNLHGPVLARNPGLADHLLSLALGRPVRTLVRTEVDELRRRRILTAMRMAD
ncbi:type 1 glutamine amidotransferase [Microlunatus speluncae]|uniref:type 1 glutamine amidotransferase n=1 Tax=Microlunatus speluncae TaxID=2594267 RepID=UPI0012666C56|nr:glutamine amidotransferase [Microlunatus speluncae]